MTRISSLFVATTLAILPIGAFAQQNAAPVKTTAPTTMTTTAPAVTAQVENKTVVNKAAADKAGTDKMGTDKMGTDKMGTDKMGADKAATAKVPGITPPAAATANATQPAKTDGKIPAEGKKNEVHGMNTATPHHAKVNVPAKTAEPAKS
jgi:hypothetical protein